MAVTWGRNGTVSVPTSPTCRPSPRNSLVSVIIVNYNGRFLLEDCLRAVAAQLYAPIEVILVDNNSSDDSVAWVRERFPTTRVVLLQRNLGFAGGCNAGIAAARGEYIATLNNDAIAEPAWIGEMIRTIQGRPDVGMVASKMLFADAPSVVNSTGIALDRAGIAWDRRGGDDDDRVESEAEVFGPCAGAALYRAALLDDVGGFDEDFFMYLEDVDLAWRARTAGWRCIYAPRARVMHHHSATAVENSPGKRFNLARNQIWLLAKNYPTPYLWLYLPAITSYLLAMTAARLIPLGSSGAGTLRAASFRGRVAGLTGIPAMVAKRHAMRPGRVPSWRILADMAGISLPWSLSRRYAHLSARSASGPFPNDPKGVGKRQLTGD